MTVRGDPHIGHNMKDPVSIPAIGTSGWNITREISDTAFTNKADNGVPGLQRSFNGTDVGLLCRRCVNGGCVIIMKISCISTCGMQFRYIHPVYLINADTPVDLLILR